MNITEATFLRNLTIRPVLEDLSTLISRSQLVGRFSYNHGWEKLLWLIANHESGLAGLSHARTNGRGGARSIYQIQVNRHDDVWRVLSRDIGRRFMNSNVELAQYVNGLIIQPRHARRWISMRAKLADYVWQGQLLRRRGGSLQPYRGTVGQSNTISPDLIYDVPRLVGSRTPSSPPGSFRFRMLHGLETSDPYATAITVLAMIGFAGYPTVNSGLNPEQLAQIWRTKHKRQAGQTIMFLANWRHSILIGAYPFRRISEDIAFLDRQLNSNWRTLPSHMKTALINSGFHRPTPP